MNKLEQQMVDAVNGRHNWGSGNTIVTLQGSCVCVYLWGNCIYRRVDGREYFNHCGWITKTTMSRLRALGADVKMKKSVAVLEGLPMKSGWHEKGENAMLLSLTPILKNEQIV